MPSTAVITLEGVLQKNVSYAPIPVGLVLYHAISSSFNIVVVSDATEKEVTHWLDIEGLNKHGSVVCNDFTLAHLQPFQRRLRQVNSLRARSFAIDLVVEPDPIVAAHLLAAGYTTLNFLHYAYALPQWRPDFEPKVKPWKELEQEAIEGALLRAEDARIKKEEDVVSR